MNVTLPRIRKPETFRTLCDVDASALRAKVVEIGEAAWKAEDARKENRFEVFHHTHHIIARFIPRNQDPLTFYATPFWTVWEPLLRPIMMRAAGPYGFGNPEFPKVMFARLAPHAVIDRHVDGAGSNLLTHKVHVPLVTNDKVWFEVEDTRFHLPAGKAYELNNTARHAVGNESDEARIHLIFEIMDLDARQGAQTAS